MEYNRWFGNDPAATWRGIGLFIILLIGWALWHVAVDLYETPSSENIKGCAWGVVYIVVFVAIITHLTWRWLS
jgi:hypothetical protein